MADLQPLKPVIHQDGFEVFFVKQPPQEIQLECSICLQLLTNPCLLDCECGNCFCKECIETIKICGNPCPLCNQHFRIIFPNKQLKRTISGLRIYCPHKDEGCLWADEMGKFSEHLNQSPVEDTRLEGCGLVYILCKFCNCSFPRKDIENHETDLCPKKPYTCQYCGQSSVLDDITENHWPLCQKFPLACPFECGKNPQRNDLERHVSIECELVLIECKFDYAGCKVLFPRKDMPAHLKESIVEHMSLLAITHRASVQEVKELRNDNHTLNLCLTSKVVESKHVEKQLRSELDTLKKEINSLKKSFHSKMTALKKDNTSLKQNLADTTKVYKNVQSQVQAVQSQVQALNHQVITLLAQSGSVSDPHSGDACARKQPSITPCEPTVLPTVLPPMVTSSIPPVELKMRNFKRIKDNKNTWNSAPFYSNEGYKMLLSAKPCGIDGTHMSLYVYIIKGEYDKHLVWPFRGEVTVTFTDQVDGKNWTRGLVYDDTCGDCGNRRHTNSLTGGYGWPSFFELRYLSNYLKKDCLIFVVDRVDSVVRCN